MTDLLDLPEFEVVQASEDCPGQIRKLVLVPRAAVGLRPHCGQLTQERHACQDREILDLPLGAYTAERLLERVAELLKHTNLSNAAALFGVAEKTMEGWYYAYLQRRQRPEQQLQPIRPVPAVSPTQASAPAAG